MGRGRSQGNACISPAGRELPGQVGDSQGVDCLSWRVLLQQVGAAPSIVYIVGWTNFCCILHYAEVVQDLKQARLVSASLAIHAGSVLVFQYTNS